MRRPVTATLTALTMLVAVTLTGETTAGGAASAASQRGCAASWRLVAVPTPPGSDALTGDPVPGESDVAFSPDASLGSASVTAGKDVWSVVSR